MSVHRISSDTFGSRLRNLLRRCAKSVFGCISSGRLSKLIVCASLVAVSHASFCASYVPITELIAGQSYGDYFHFKLMEDGKITTKLLDTISEKDFLAKLAPSSKSYFLYKWLGSRQGGTYAKIDNLGFSTDTQGFDTTGTGAGIADGTVQAIAAAGLPVFVSNGNPRIDYHDLDSRILPLFPDSEKDEGFVFGVVDAGCTKVYDMTSRCSEYISKGSYTSWDGKEYVNIEDPDKTVLMVSYIELNSRGIEAFYNDMRNAQGYMTAKTEEEIVTQPVIQSTNSTEQSETAGFTNIVITSYYTNKTVIVDPYFQNLNSILKFKYPKYATEGDWVLYKFERSGVLVEPLTVHMITNGHWCANVRWEANESGEKVVRLRIPVSDDFNDNDRMEVLVKTLNRRVDTDL